MNLLEDIPRPSDRHIAIRVKPAAERALKRGHPWLFDQSIIHQNHQGNAGDLAIIFDHQNRFLAIGLYDPHSPIRVRLLEYGQQAEINSIWLSDKLETAANLRLPLNNTKTTGYRLVHGENDGLPGMVIDRYDQTFVIRLDTAAWVPYLPETVQRLGERESIDRVVLRLSRNSETHVKRRFGLANGQLLYGSPLSGLVSFEENGITFLADVVHGQKTGFFFDQRENRARLENILHGNSQFSDMLNLFAYTGGFALYAARAGMNHITNIDSSVAALEIAGSNLHINQARFQFSMTQQKMIVCDVFQHLQELRTAGERYDVIVVDPPSFAKRQSEVPGALEAYHKLAVITIGLIREGGLLVFASCSSRVSSGQFFMTIHKASKSCGRHLTELARTGHPVDHPIGFPHGEYLKCLFATLS